MNKDLSASQIVLFSSFVFAFVILVRVSWLLSPSVANVGSTRFELIMLLTATTLVVVPSFMRLLEKVRTPNSLSGRIALHFIPQHTKIAYQALIPASLVLLVAALFLPKHITAWMSILVLLLAITSSLLLSRIASGLSKINDPDTFLRKGDLLAPDASAIVRDITMDSFHEVLPPDSPHTRPRMVSTLLIRIQDELVREMNRHERGSKRRIRELVRSLEALGGNFTQSFAMELSGDRLAFPRLLELLSISSLRAETLTDELLRSGNFLLGEWLYRDSLLPHQKPHQESALAGFLAFTSTMRERDGATWEAFSTHVVAPTVNGLRERLLQTDEPNSKWEELLGSL